MLWSPLTWPCRRKEDSELVRLWRVGWKASVMLGLVGAMFVGGVARAQPDYPPALWNPAYSGHWYATGNSHSFCVIHDMEGYYLATISYFQQSGTQASAHYCVNSLHNGSDTLGH